MDPYPYSPLQPDEIRLLQLFWGEENSDLVANLAAHRLLEDEDEELHAVGNPDIPIRLTEPATEMTKLNPKNPSPIPRAERYEALSYTWGVEDATSAIRVLEHNNHYTIPIKPNLEKALRQFRKQIPPGKTQAFWIDALCMNQASENNPEKSTQIKKMSLIYNRADNVRVWLGEAYEDSDRAMSFIQRFLKLDDFDKLVKDPGTPPDWLAFMDLLRRPWFNRRWIVQEIGVARIATVHCGASTVPWQSFANAVSLFTSKNHDLRKLFQRAEAFDHHPDLLGEVEALGANDLVDAVQNLVMKSEEGIVLELQYSLEALMSLLTVFEASLPHDTVYAILWLAHDAEPEPTRSAAKNEDAVAITPRPGSPVNGIPTGLGDDFFSEKDLHHGLTRSMSKESGGEPLIRNHLGNSLEIPSTSTAHGKSAVDKSLREAEKGFVQLSKDKPNPFVVDYTISVYELCMKFLDFAISRSKSLDIICRPWAPLPPDHEDPLPSWIPSILGKPFGLKGVRRVYTRVKADPLVGKPGMGPRVYNACGKTRAYWGQELILGTQRELVTCGFELDKIGRLKDRAHGGIIPYSWLELVKWTNTDESPPEKFWRTLVADRGLSGLKPPVYFQAACKWAFAQRAPGDGLNTKEPITHGKCPSIAMDFLRRVQAVIWDRRLFQSEGKKHRHVSPGGTVRRKKKLIGIAPGSARKGDFLCILYGCSVPVVLRKHDGPMLIRRTTASSDRSEESTTEWDLSSNGSTKGSLSENQSMQDHHRRKSSTTLRPPSRSNTDGDEDRGRIVPGGKLTGWYEFIGECYVHGMMDGEGFKHQREHKIPLREIHLI